MQSKIRSRKHYYKTQKKDDIRKEKRERINIIVNISLAAFTAFLFFVATYQTYQTRQSVAIADSSLIVTKQSVELAQENFRIENSALLAPIEIGFSFDNVNFKKCTISLSVKNYGKTVADSVSYWSHYVVSEKNISYNPVIRKEFSKIPYFILPYEKSPIEDSVDERYLNSKSAELASTVKRFFFYGEVRYKTIGRFDTLEFMYVNTSLLGEFESYGTFNKLR
jgi:hypothetical protein